MTQEPDRGQGSASTVAVGGRPSLGGMRIAALSLRRLALNVLFWTALFTFVLAVRYYDIGNIAFINLPVVIPLERIFVNGVTLGLVVGIAYSLVEQRLESLNLYDQSLMAIIVRRTLYLFIVCGLALAAVSWLNFFIDLLKGNIDGSKVGYSRYLFSATVQFLFLAALVGNFALSVFHTLRTKIGHTEFGHLLAGRYRQPREELRAFMFLDLRSSTTIAEQLGHRRYSSLIQDCFRDLTGAVLETGADIYQYVGDEAVLTWPADVAVRDANCVRAFEHYSRRIEARAGYYQDSYGVVPRFKAGVNIGQVTVVEVGVLKRAIVYHGDVLNTAARVQALCNEYERLLLVTDSVRQALGDERCRFEPVGEFMLRGKTQAVQVFAAASVR